MKEPLDEYLVKTDLDNFETDPVGTQTKKVSLYAFDTDTLEKKRVTGKADGTQFGISIDNQASSEEAVLLRRIVKLLESNAVVDINHRQRIVVESIAGSALGRSMTGLDSGVVPVPNLPANTGAPTPAPGTTYWQPVWAGPVDPRFTNIEQAKINYNTGIRPNLIFS